MIEPLFIAIGVFVLIELGYAAATCLYRVSEANQRPSTASTNTISGDGAGADSSSSVSQRDGQRLSVDLANSLQLANDFASALTVILDAKARSESQGDADRTGDASSGLSGARGPKEGHELSNDGLVPHSDLQSIALVKRQMLGDALSENHVGSLEGRWLGEDFQVARLLLRGNFGASAVLNIAKNLKIGDRVAKRLGATNYDNFFVELDLDLSRRPGVVHPPSRTSDFSWDIALIPTLSVAPQVQVELDRHGSPPTLKVRGEAKQEQSI